MSEEDTILPSVQTTMALDAKVHAYFKNKNWCDYWDGSPARHCTFCTDCFNTQYHISVKCPKISRWLLPHDPDISIWYDDSSCKIRFECTGDPNCYRNYI